MLFKSGGIINRRRNQKDINREQCQSSQQKTESNDGNNGGKDFRFMFVLVMACKANAENDKHLQKSSQTNSELAMLTLQV